jgi:hypothetical protein
MMLLALKLFSDTVLFWGLCLTLLQHRLFVGPSIMDEIPPDMANRNRQLNGHSIRGFTRGMVLLVFTIGVVQLTIYQPMENPKLKGLLVDDTPQVPVPPLLLVIMLQMGFVDNAAIRGQRFPFMVVIAKRNAKTKNISS